MNFLKFIENLRKKPYYVRVQILIISVIVCMVPVILIWIHCLKSNIYSKDKKEIKEVKEKTASVWEIFKKNISVFFEKNIEIKKEKIPKYKNKSENKKFPTLPIQKH